MSQITAPQKEKALSLAMGVKAAADLIERILTFNGDAEMMRDSLEILERSSIELLQVLQDVTEIVPTPNMKP